MKNKFVTNVSVNISAPIEKVWDALINPEIIKLYMFGSEAVSDWKEGSPIVWKGVWNEKPYQDHGVILKIEPEKILQYTHYGPVTELNTIPENYPVVTCTLSKQDNQVHLSISQDNNATEQIMEQSEKMWEMMLSELKKQLEK